MFFLNLSFPEFLALYAAVSAVVVTLYLLSRSRRRQVVPTLRFWVNAMQPVASSRRRRIQQPWSLLLQLLSLLLLLLAISQLKLGNRETAQRDHVLLLDASSWMGSQVSAGAQVSAAAPGRTLLDEARQKARQFIRALPPSDRVMIVRADSLPSPATGMESDRQILERAIDETRPGASALNLDQALLFADQIRRLHNSRNGEIIYVGPGRLATGGQPIRTPANLRVVPVEGSGDNAGLVQVGARRSDSEPDLWDVFVGVHNYAGGARRLPVTVTFGGAPVGSTILDVKPNSTESFTFHFRTRSAGWIEARLMVRDALEDDNRAILEIPEQKSLKVAVFTSEPEPLRPVLAANPQVAASFYTPDQYRPNIEADVIIADRFAPAPEPKAPVIYLEPPADSIFHSRMSFEEPKAVTWHTDHEITSGIRTRDLRLPAGEILSPAKGDVVLASVEGGAVALVRPDKRAVAFGFHPVRNDLKFELTTPLLIANVLRWMQPDVFRFAEVHGGSVGAVTATLDGEPDPKDLKVLFDKQELPYTIEGHSVKFFSGSPGVVRVLTGSREQVYSLSLPEVGESTWTAPQSVRRGIPGGFGQAVSRDLWQILAALGALGLLADWLIFGNRKAVAVRPAGAAAPLPDEAATLRRAS